MRLPRLRLSRVVALAAASVLVLVACGGDKGDDPAASVAPGKPTVKIPGALPTELVITDLVEGTGKAAALGDTVLVHYVGVRSADGTEFDNNYDADVMPVTLGQTQVIQGWTDGLVGSKQGGQRQLDIPAALAYGDESRGDIIQAGDALTFVLDIVAMIPTGDPADAPHVTVEGGANQEKIDIKDLVKGDGAVVQTGQTAAVQIVAFRADTGEEISSTWAQGGVPLTFVVGSSGFVPGIELAVEGMAVGGRRQVHVPYLLAFGDAGSEGLHLPPKTDMVLVVDLVSVYLIV